MDKKIFYISGIVSLSPEEECHLWNEGLTAHGDSLESVTVTGYSNDSISVTYNVRVVPVDRIRRITGYLVGTLDSFNDAKRSEERDRIKHS